MLSQRELETGRLVLPFGGDGLRLICHRLLYLKSKLKLPKIKWFRERLFDELATSPM